MKTKILTDFQICFSVPLIDLQKYTIKTSLLINEFTAWKVSKYGVFFGPYFPVFGPEKTPYLDTFHEVSFP